MGHGASLLQAEEDEEHAQEIAAHLMEEIAKLKEQGMVHIVVYRYICSFTYIHLHM